MAVPLRCYEVHPYRAHVHFCYQAEETEYLAEHLSLSEVEVDNRGLRGGMTAVRDGELLCGCLISLKRRSDPPTTAHECLHAALVILDYVGVRYSGDDSEPLTYLMDDLIEAANRMLYPRRRRSALKSSGRSEGR